MMSSAFISVSLLIGVGMIPLASLAQTAPQQHHGTIEGTLIYPGSILPAQKVCATHLETQEVFCTETRQSQTQYTLNVPSGAYYVFTTACTQIYPVEKSCVDGYDAQRAYYNAYVECGLTYQCQQKVMVNEPLPIKVLAGATQTNINPHDWYTD